MNGVPLSNIPPGPVPGGPVMGQPQMMGKPQGIQGVAVPGKKVVQWMTKPASIFGCPEGLQYLIQLDQLVIKKKVGRCGKQHYTHVIKNSIGQQIYYVFQGLIDNFTLHFADNLKKEIIRMSRKTILCTGFQCCFLCCKCCALEIVVESPPGRTIGYVIQSASCLNLNFQIYNANKEPILDIEGPCCDCHTVCGCTCHLNFRVKSIGSEYEVGNISKQWVGCVKWTFSREQTYGLAFPLDLDVEAKATLIGATLLIDFILLDQGNSNNINYQLHRENDVLRHKSISK